MNNKTYNIFLLFFYLLLLILINCIPVQAISNTIIINEIIYDPIGSDLGYEWIELYNKSENGIDMNNWKIQIAGSEFKDTIILSNINNNTILEPYTYYSICERKVENCTYYVDKIGMQNGGSESDGIRILDNKGYVIDTIIYDRPNSNNLIDDLGTINDNTANKTISGESLGRINHIDTDNSMIDFKVYKEPSLNNINPIQEDLENTGDSLLYILIIPLFILSINFGTLLIDLILINRFKWQKD